jgi:hypothetical protein
VQLAARAVLFSLHEVFLLDKKYNHQINTNQAGIDE